jgi:hypothetical protein
MSLIKSLEKRLRRLKQFLQETSDRAWRSVSSVEKVFTDIYRERKWGAALGGEEFDSGLGSAQSDAVQEYVNAVIALASEKGFTGKTFVDIGCGDFRIGSRLLPSVGLYIGVDVVRPLIERNRRLFTQNHVRFEHADATRAPLPPGEVCLLRQVLQHLSNRQIMAILRKLDQYKWVIITEHVPTETNLTTPNLDKLHGADIRARRHSGVYLDQPPFGIPSKNLSLVLEVPGTDLGPSVDAGVIRTYLYEPCK